MTDYPERISISPVYRQKRADDFYLVDMGAFPGKGTEYVRTDIHEAALLARAETAEAENARLKEAISRYRKWLDHERRLCEAAGDRAGTIGYRRAVNALDDTPGIKP